MKVFANETYFDFSKKEILEKQKAAIQKVRKQFGREYPNIINGKEVKTQNKTRSVNPANPDELVGIFQKGGKIEVDQILKNFMKKQMIWS
jgi:delta 1-pyrroline-5-carboxylate dehydrogenase